MLTEHDKAVLDAVGGAIKRTMARTSKTVPITLTNDAPVIHNDVQTPEVHVKNELTIPVPEVNVHYDVKSPDVHVQAVASPPNIVVNVDMAPVAEYFQGLLAALATQTELLGALLSALAQKEPRVMPTIRVENKDGVRRFIPE